MVRDGAVVAYRWASSGKPRGLKRERPREALRYLIAIVEGRCEVAAELSRFSVPLAFNSAIEENRLGCRSPDESAGAIDQAVPFASRYRGDSVLKLAHVVELGFDHRASFIGIGCRMVNRFHNLPNIVHCNGSFWVAVGLRRDLFHPDVSIVQSAANSPVRIEDSLVRAIALAEPRNNIERNEADHRRRAIAQMSRIKLLKCGFPIFHRMF